MSLSVWRLLLTLLSAFYWDRRFFLVLLSVFPVCTFERKLIIWWDFGVFLCCLLNLKLIQDLASECESDGQNWLKSLFCSLNLCLRLTVLFAMYCLLHNWSSCYQKMLWSLVFFSDSFLFSIWNCQYPAILTNKISGFSHTQHNKMKFLILLTHFQHTTLRNFTGIISHFIFTLYICLHDSFLELLFIIFQCISFQILALPDKASTQPVSPHLFSPRTLCLSYSLDHQMHHPHSSSH